MCDLAGNKCDDGSDAMFLAHSVCNFVCSTLLLNEIITGSHHIGLCIKLHNECKITWNLMVIMTRVNMY